MKNSSILHNVITKMNYYIRAQQNRILVLFAIEGVLITLVNNLVGNNNNLFATRLGANDFELSMVITLPQLVGMLVLIPGGIITDHMKNKRNMVTASLALLAGSYFFIGFTPMLGTYKLIAFLALLAISTAPMTIYNVSWQAYFADTVKGETRNSILTVRNSFNFLIGILIPLSAGALLASAKTVGEKLKYHQLYLWVACFLLIIQIFVLRRIKNNEESKPAEISIREIKAALCDLRYNKKFLGFIGVALFFYLTWHIDWTLYFIGQVNYLGMNEAWLSYGSIVNAVVQFLTIGFWSRLNIKKGIRFTIIFGNLGLACFPIGMIVSTSLAAEYSKIVFLIISTLSSFAFATISLNIPLCLLQVIPEKNKTLNISIYTVLVTLSNAIMPLAGVAFYKALGADLAALHRVFWIIFIFRIIATSLWVLRWWLLRKDPK